MRTFVVVGLALSLTFIGCTKKTDELTSDFKPSEAPALPPGPDTLQKTDEVVGTGPEAQTGDKVKMHYTEYNLASINTALDDFKNRRFTGRGVIERISLVVDHPRPFVRSKTYFGPDRRRRVDPHWPGPHRRATDEKPQQRVAAHEI